MTAILRQTRRWFHRAAFLAGRIFTGPTQPNHGEIKRVLLLRPDHLGDCILTLPAIARFRAACPDIQVDVALGPWSMSLAEIAPEYSYIPIHYPGFDRSRRRKGLAPYLYQYQLARAMRRQRYDLAVVLRFDHWWGAQLAALAGIPALGYAVEGMRPYLSYPVAYVPGRHEIEQSGLLIDEAIRRAGGSPPAETIGPPRVTVGQSEPPAGLDRQYAVFHPGSGAAVKRWRSEGYRALAAALKDQFGLAVAVTGAASESALVEETAAAAGPGAVTLVGLPLARIAGIVRGARVVVGPDSGILHLASAVGAPSVRLFGPVDHRTFGPWRDPLAVTVVSTMGCVPCNRLDYRDDELPAHPCVRDLEIDRVVAAAEGLLERTGVQRRPAAQ